MLKLYSKSSETFEQYSKCSKSSKIFNDVQKAPKVQIVLNNIQKSSKVQRFLNDIQKIQTFKHVWTVFKKITILWIVFKNATWANIFEYIQNLTRSLFWMLFEKSKCSNIFAFIQTVQPCSKNELFSKIQKMKNRSKEGRLGVNTKNIEAKIAFSVKKKPRKRELFQ